MESTSESFFQGNIPNQAPPIPVERTEKILDQAKKQLCKIYMSNGDFGSGFFCKIPFPDENHKLNVLFTNNHVLNKDAIKNGKIIKFSLDNDKIKKEIVIDDTRKTYTSVELDTTIIELKPNVDEIDSFLEIDYILFKLSTDKAKEKYDDKGIYIIQYSSCAS